jgi:hypothetical protein
MKFRPTQNFAIEVLMNQNRTELEKCGYSITSEIYSKTEIGHLLQLIDSATPLEGSKIIFSIRALLNTIPDLAPVLFNDSLKSLIKTIGGKDYFMTKSIYFDKPEHSNWFVSYHQDLSISVKEKHEVEGYINWTHKIDHFGVQPPEKILQNTLTVRIHLDNTDATNGALKVLVGSHLNGVKRFDTEWLKSDDEQICEVKSGSSMVMKPLIFHASGRNLNGKRRRVIHLEFCNQELATPLEWSERSKWNK